MANSRLFETVSVFLFKVRLFDLVKCETEMNSYYIPGQFVAQNPPSGGRYSTKFGEAPPRGPSHTLLYTTFDRNSTPFVYQSTDNCTLYIYLWSAELLLLNFSPEKPVKEILRYVCSRYFESSF